jgi:hypothetical protein
MELLLGHEKIITKSGISLNAGTLNRGFTVVGIIQSLFHSSFFYLLSDEYKYGKIFGWLFQV